MFETLFNNLPIGILVVARSGAIRLANSAAESMFGRGRGGLVGAHIEALVPPRYRASHAARRSAYFAEPTARAMGPNRELQAVRLDGSEFPIAQAEPNYEAPHPENPAF